MTLWVSGEPPTFLTPREAAWKAKIKERVGEFHLAPGVGIALSFVVTSWQRRGHWFDLDNLVKPVLDTLSRPNAAFLEAAMRRGPDPGVTIATGWKPSRILAPVVWFEDLPRGSYRRPEIHPVLIGLQRFDGISPLRVHMAVHEADSLTDFDFTGFVKPTIDRLWPIIGGTETRPKDHLIRHLIVTRSSARASGISIGIEPLEERQI